MLQQQDLGAWADEFRLQGHRSFSLSLKSFTKENLFEIFKKNNKHDLRAFGQLCNKLLTIRGQFLVVKMTYLDSYSGVGPLMENFTEARKQIESFLNDSSAIQQVFKSNVLAGTMNKFRIADIQGL